VEQWLNDLFAGHGAEVLYSLTVLVLILAGLGLPLPEEGIFLAAGYAGQAIQADVWILCIAGLVGIMLGDSVPYYLGRHYGFTLLKKWPFSKLLSARNIARTQEFFDKHGSKTVFCARFVAGLRMPTFFMAGTMGVKYRAFFFWDLLGALISCPTSIWLAYHYGPVVKDWIAQSHVVLYIFIGLVVAYMIYHIVSHRPEKHEAAPVGDLPVPPKGDEVARPVATPKAEPVSARLPE